MASRYQHHHDRLLEVSWEDFGRMARDLAKAVKDRYGPECVVGNSKGGCIVGGTLAAILRLDFYPMRVSRRRNDQVVFETPRLIVPPPEEVAGRKVLLVDDMAVSGETFEIIKGLFRTHTPKDVKTLALARHHTDYVPDFFGIASDDCIAFPWDRWVYSGEGFVIHPELVVGDGSPITP